MRANGDKIYANSDTSIGSHYRKNEPLWSDITVYGAIWWIGHILPTTEHCVLPYLHLTWRFSRWWLLVGDLREWLSCITTGIWYTQKLCAWLWMPSKQRICATPQNRFCRRGWIARSDRKESDRLCVLNVESRVFLCRGTAKRNLHRSMIVS